MTNLWLTRTMPAAKDSAVAWEQAGYEVLLEPLLQIEAVDHDPLPKDAVLVFTSKNGIEHVQCDGQRAICVGDATAEKARHAGYRDVVSVDGRSEDITAWIAQNLQRSEPIIHVSGWHVRGQITEDLTVAGFCARRIKVYRSIPHPIWPDLPTSKVVFYSPLAANVFMKLAIDLCKDVSELTAICISAATANELSGLALKAIVIPERPREDELIMAAQSNPRPALEV